MNQLWSTINTQQIIVMMPLFSVNLPANAGKFFNIVHQVAAFDLIDVGYYYDLAFDEEPTDAINIQFEQLGFDTTSFVANLGTLILSYVLLGLLLVVYGLLHACKRSIRSFELRIQIGRGVFWNPVITLINESYSIVVLSAFINLSHLKWNGSGASLNSLLAISFVSMTVVYPALLYRVWRKKFRILD